MNALLKELYVPLDQLSAQSGRAQVTFWRAIGRSGGARQAVWDERMGVSLMHLGPPTPLPCRRSPAVIPVHVRSDGVTGTYGGESRTSPAAILKHVTPPDDAGAATYDRYEWQAVMAAADVLAAYYECLDEHGTPQENVSFEVICEHHEDWAVSDGHAAEIVSAKHKETSAGAFTTIRNLLADGGVLHLLDRWLALGRGPTCRLVTTSGLAADARSLMDVAQAFAAGAPDGPDHDGIMTKLEEALAQARSSKTKDDDGITHGLTSDGAEKATIDRETLAAFLGVLRIQDSQPSRDYVTLMAAGAYAKPVADKLSAPAAAEAIWGAVHGLVRERMRAAGPRRRGRLPTVLGGRDEPRYETRTVTFLDVRLAVRIAIDNQSAFGPLPRRVRTSRVAIKMTVGGCSDNAVERAETLRRQYRRYWREVRATPTVNPAQRRVENDLLRLVDEATDTVRPSGQNWGPALWREIQVRLNDAVASSRFHGLDADLLLGGVSELSSECKAWFSAAFDVDAVANRLMREVAGTATHAGAALGSGHAFDPGADPSGIGA